MTDQSQGLQEPLLKDTPNDLCPGCQRAKATKLKSRLCSTCYKKDKLTQKAGQRPLGLSVDLIARASLAKTSEDWQRLAAELAPIMTAILNGEVKATAAQASLLKDIWNRAFGKPVATQSEKKVASGVIVLPALMD